MYFKLLHPKMIPPEIIATIRNKSQIASWRSPAFAHSANGYPFGNSAAVPLKVPLVRGHRII